MYIYIYIYIYTCLYTYCIYKNMHIMDPKWPICFAPTEHDRFRPLFSFMVRVVTGNPRPPFDTPVETMNVLDVWKNAAPNTGLYNYWRWAQRTTCHSKNRFCEMIPQYSLATQALWQLPTFWLPRFGYCGVRQRTAGVELSSFPGETSGCPLVIEHSYLGIPEQNGGF